MKFDAKTEALVSVKFWAVKFPDGCQGVALPEHEARQRAQAWNCYVPKGKKRARVVRVPNSKIRWFICPV